MSEHGTDFVVHLFLIFAGSVLQVNATNAKRHGDEDEGGQGHCVGNAVEGDVFFHVIIFFWNQPRGLRIRKRLA